MKDIGWVAGFLEGEGCFGQAQRRIFVSVSQKEREPLDKLQSIAGGGRMYQFFPKGRNPIWRWEATGSHAAGLMMTVFSMVSSRRREKITAVLKWWRSVPSWPAKRRS